MASPPARSTEAPRTSYGRQLERSAHTFLIPYLLVAAIFFLYPFIQAVILAFFQTNGPRSRIFVGLSNFAFILTDRDFHIALRNTTVFAFFSIFLQLPLSLVLALLLNSRKDRLRSFFRLALFSPHLVGQIFVGIIFSVMFVPQYGLLNRFLQAVSGWGLQQQWLQDPRLVMPALVITSLWMYVGFNMIYFLAALQSVDQGLVEAAQIDGAGPWAMFKAVILPAIKPVMTFVVIMSTIGSFQLFELPYALLQGFGPKNSGLTIVGYLYKNAFNAGDLGTGAAVGWILALIIFAISLVQVRLSGTLRKD